MLVALSAIVDVESWATMREQFGLSVEEASAAWLQAIDRLLPPTPHPDVSSLSLPLSFVMKAGTV